MKVHNFFSLLAASALFMAFEASAAKTRTLEVTPTYTVLVREDESDGSKTQWFECTEARSPKDIFKKVTENKPKAAPKYFSVKMEKSPFKDGNLTRTDEISKYIKRCNGKVEEAVKGYSKQEYKERDGEEFTLKATTKKNDKLVHIVNSAGKRFLVDIDTGKQVDEAKQNAQDKKTNVTRGKASAIQTAARVCLQDIETKKTFTEKLSALIRQNWSARFVGSHSNEIGAEKFYYITGQEEGPFSKGEEICSEAGKKTEKVEEMERIWPSMAGIATLDGNVARGENPVGAPCEGFERNNLRGKVTAYGVPKADYADTPKERVVVPGAREPLMRGYFCKYTYTTCGIKTKVVPCGSSAE